MDCPSPNVAGGALTRGGNRVNKVLPQCVWSASGGGNLNCATPDAEDTLPTRPEVLKEGRKLKCKESETASNTSDLPTPEASGAGPRQAMDCNGMEGPECAKSSSGGGKPVQVCLNIGALGPACAGCRMRGADPEWAGSNGDMSEAELDLLDIDGASPVFARHRSDEVSLNCKGLKATIEGSDRESPEAARDTSNCAQLCRTVLALRYKKSGAMGDGPYQETLKAKNTEPAQHDDLSAGGNAVCTKSGGSANRLQHASPKVVATGSTQEGRLDGVEGPESEGSGGSGGSSERAWPKAAIAAPTQRQLCSINVALE